MCESNGFLIESFKELRECWYHSNLHLYAHERIWEDEEDEEIRERSNRTIKELFDKQTNDLINGIRRPIAPHCENDMRQSE